MKNTSVDLFFGSSSMSMPIFVQMDEQGSFAKPKWNFLSSHSPSPVCLCDTVVHRAPLCELKTHFFKLPQNFSIFETRYTIKWHFLDPLYNKMAFWRPSYTKKAFWRLPLQQNCIFKTLYTTKQHI